MRYATNVGASNRTSKGIDVEIPDRWTKQLTVMSGVAFSFIVATALWVCLPREPPTTRIDADSTIEAVLGDWPVINEVTVISQGQMKIFTADGTEVTNRYGHDVPRFLDSLGDFAFSDASTDGHRAFLATGSEVRSLNPDFETAVLYRQPNHDMIGDFDIHVPEALLAIGKWNLSIQDVSVGVWITQNEADTDGSASVFFVDECMPCFSGDGTFLATATQDRQFFKIRTSVTHDVVAECFLNCTISCVHALPESGFAVGTEEGVIFFVSTEGTIDGKSELGKLPIRQIEDLRAGIIVANAHGHVFLARKALDGVESSLVCKVPGTPTALTALYSQHAPRRVFVWVGCVESSIYVFEPNR